MSLLEVNKTSALRGFDLFITFIICSDSYVLISWLFNVQNVQLCNNGVVCTFLSVWKQLLTLHCSDVVHSNCTHTHTTAKTSTPHLNTHTTPTTPTPHLQHPHHTYNTHTTTKTPTPHLKHPHNTYTTLTGEGSQNYLFNDIWESCARALRNVCKERREQLLLLKLAIDYSGVI